MKKIDFEGASQTGKRRPGENLTVLSLNENNFKKKYFKKLIGQNRLKMKESYFRTLCMPFRTVNG